VHREKSPEIYNRFVLNSWEEADTETLVLTEKLLRTCIGISPLYQDDRKLISIDVATSDEGRTVLSGFVGTERKHVKVLRGRNTMEIVYYVDEMNALMKKVHLVAGDSIGEGKGLFDRLEERGYPCHRVIASEKAQDPVRFKNVRAEMWWYVREQLEHKLIVVPDDEELIQELTSLHYIPNSEMAIKLESKELACQRLPSGIDKADSWVMGIYALQFIRENVTENQGKDRYRNKSKVLSAMCG